MTARVVLVLLIASLLCPVSADTLLWDNGAPDWREKFVAPTHPEDAQGDAWTPQPGFVELADDFETQAPWRVTRIWVRGMFGPLREDDDLNQVQKSARVEVKIYSPDEEGRPGKPFWSTKLEGDEAAACQTFPAEPPIGDRDFTDANLVGSTIAGKLVDIQVNNPDGLVTLPAGKWFVAWRVQRSALPSHPEGALSFSLLSSPYPHADFDGDHTFYGMGCSYDLVQKFGDRAVYWSDPYRGSEKPKRYNMAFKIYGDRQ